MTRNALWNSAGTITSMVAGFITAPFLISRLGDTTYGLWILVGSLTSYFALLDLGVRGSVGRNIAMCNSQGDFERASSILSTAVWLLSAVALIAAGGCFIAYLMFCSVFSVPEDQVNSVKLAILLVGLNLVVTFPFSVFDAVIWAHQRFDSLNRVDIMATIVRTALTFWLVGIGHGLVALAALTLAVTLASTAAKGLMAFWIAPRLKCRPSFVNRSAASTLYSYGVWLFALSMARTLSTQVPLLIVGLSLGVAVVTPYAVASRLTGYVTALLIAATQVTTPRCTSIFARGGMDGLRSLTIAGTRYSLALSLYFSGAMIILGNTFITLWVGAPVAATSFPLLCAMVLGDVLPSSQWVSYSAILGMGRHRPLAIAVMIELIATSMCAFAVAGVGGPLGVAVVVAIGAISARGLFQMCYICSLFNMRLSTYISLCLLPPLFAMSVPTTLLAISAYLFPPRDWVALITVGASYSITCGVAVAFMYWRASSRTADGWHAKRFPNTWLRFGLEGSNND